MEKMALEYQALFFLCSLSPSAVVFEFAVWCLTPLGIEILQEILAGHVQTLTGHWRPCPVTQWPTHCKPLPPSNHWNNIPCWDGAEEAKPGSAHLLGLPLTQRQIGNPLGSQPPHWDPLRPELEVSERLGPAESMAYAVALQLWDDGCQACAKTAECAPDFNPPWLTSSAWTEWGRMAV